MQLKGKTQLATAVEPKEGTYKIVEVEEVKTAVQGFSGIRVKMNSTKKGDETSYATMLWSRAEASQTSKLGSFLKAFADFFKSEDDAMETDNWVGHTIRINSWASKKREVEVLE